MLEKMMTLTREHLEAFWMVDIPVLWAIALLLMELEKKREGPIGDLW